MESLSGLIKINKTKDKTIMKTKYKLTILALVVATVAGIFIFKDQGNTETQYITSPVSKGNLSNNVLATGSVSAYQKVSVGAQVSGQIKKLAVKLGDKVEKGQLIAEIDDTTQQNDLDTAMSNLDIYQAQLKSKNIALKIAQSQFTRQNNLYRQNAGSKEDFENAQNTLALTQSQVEELKANIKQAQIAANTAKVNLGYTKILAPLSGVVVTAPVEEGQTVNSNQTTPTIVEIADLDKVLIKSEISEGDITKVKPGQEVSFTILSDPTNVYHTTLKSVDPGPTTLTDNTSTSSSGSSSSSSSSNAIYYYGNLVVDNKDNNLRIDMTTQISIKVQSVNDALYVPKIAVKKDKQGEYVNVLLPDNKVERKNVKTGIKDDMNIEIISGLDVNDKVITSQLQAGEKVSEGRPPRGMRM